LRASAGRWSSLRKASASKSLNKRVDLAGRASRGRAVERHDVSSRLCLAAAQGANAILLYAWRMKSERSCRCCRSKHRQAISGVRVAKRGAIQAQH
jgi:hypothetical protein